MRFGAIVEGEQVKFTVWARDAKSIDVVIYSPSGEEVIPLTSQENAVFSVVTNKAKEGSLYKYRINSDSNLTFPDPVSTFQPEGVHGPSQVCSDGSNFKWTDTDWKGAFEDTVIYELHVGTFSEDGTYKGVEQKLQYLKELGINTIELMPLADFPGNRNWGYDGVSLYAPARCYGTPDELRHFIDTAHQLGLAVLIDAVYNHLGPDGNYVSCYSKEYFTDKHETPWGAALNIDLSLYKDGKESSAAHMVRSFLIANAIYWLKEFHFDGLRLDAVHALVDESTPHFLQELVTSCRSAVNKRILIVAEDSRNLPLLLQPPPHGYGLDGVWSDDLHHQVRVMLAGDNEGYFMDFTGNITDLVQTINLGWFYVGQKSINGNHERGAPPGDISDMSKFCVCIQNHDQIGNRAFGDRLHHTVDLSSYKAASALLLTVPEMPLLFMGQEFAASSPFLFFTDHKPELGKLVTEGRRREFSKFRAFSDEKVRETIPDPQALSTFRSSKLNWKETQTAPHSSILKLYQSLLSLRAKFGCLRCSARDKFKAFVGYDEKSFCAVILRSAINAEEPSIISIINLKGTCTVDLNKITEIDKVLDGAESHVLLTTEDEQFQTESEHVAQKPTLSVSNSSLRIEFRGPAAILLCVQRLELK